MTDFYNEFMAANWDEVRDFFSRGSPPLGLQFLGFNALIFILWMIRRMRGATPMRRQTGLMVQALFIGANLVMLLEGDLRRLIFWT